MDTHLLPPGSLLEVPGRLWGLYKHFGVYLGDALVIHSVYGRNVEIITLAGFCGGRKFTVREYGTADPLGFQMRLQAAMRNPVRYDLVASNCEHFAAWLRTGKAESPQLWGLLGIALIAGGLALAISRRG